MTGATVFTQTKNKVCDKKKSLKESLATRPRPGNGRMDGLTNTDLFVLCNGGILNSLALYLPMPQYTKEARKAGVVCSVSLYVCIDEQGKVCGATVCDGEAVLLEAAIRTAYAAKFRPQLFSGKPTSYSGILVMNFRDDAKKGSR
jgi:hypothetical protein